MIPAEQDPTRLGANAHQQAVPALDAARTGDPFSTTIESHPWILGVLLGGILTFSVIDGLLTTAEVGLGIAREANPVLQAFFALNPWVALLFKVVLTALVVVGMWRGRRSRLIDWLAVATFVGYGALIAYHFGSLSGLGWI